MLALRIIPCLDCQNGNVVKGIGFKNLRTLGPALPFACYYEEQGADELIILDISATLEARRNNIELVKQIRTHLSIPLTVGGGIRSLEDAFLLLQAGADKVSLNTQAVLEPTLITKLAKVFGSQCVVVAIDAEKDLETGEYWVNIRSGTQVVKKQVFQWAEEAVERGAGELLVTSRNLDGTKTGYDLELLKALAERVRVPIIASGGAYTREHFLDGAQTGASALLAASVFHERQETPNSIKRYLSQQGIRVRL